MTNIDTNNAELTFSLIKDEPAIIVDSLYEGLSNSLMNQGRFPLLFSHLDFYQRHQRSFLKAIALRTLMNGYYYSQNDKIDFGDIFFFQTLSDYQRLTSEQKTDHLRKLAYLLALAFTILLSTIIIFLMRKRNMMHKERLQQMATELQSNQKELSLLTERFLSKNKVVEEMEIRLKELEGQIELNQDTEQLSELYQFKILTEEDWQEFKILFDKVHPGLISKLRSQYPDLAPAEERQFLLIRLNIDNKESANMLGISIPGVKKNRYRLKKRFGLGEEDNLDEFVKQI